MILSRGRRFIFVHIPKTGGTALALSLEGRAMKDDILIGDTPKARARSRRWRGGQGAWAALETLDTGRYRRACL